MGHGHDVFLDLLDGKSGLLAKSRGADEIAGLILNILGDNFCARAIGEAGREFVRQRFSKRRFLDDIARLYEDLISA